MYPVHLHFLQFLPTCSTNEKVEMFLRMCVFLCWILNVMLCAGGGLRQDGKSEIDHRNEKPCPFEGLGVVGFAGSFC